MLEFWPTQKRVWSGAFFTMVYNQGGEEQALCSMCGDLMPWHRRSLHDTCGELVTPAEAKKRAVWN